jgi:predicted lipoprotein with Yx(FWY)xxD motif
MKLVALSALAAASALTLSACGSAASGTTTAAGQGGAQGSARGAGATREAGIHVAMTSLGRVLVDGSGRTLYVLSADSRGRSTCSDQCLQFWPAAAPGAAAKLGVATGRTATPGGTAIATVAGHPVYTFALDHQPGDVNGEGVQEFGGTWDAASPTGTPVTAASSGSSSTPASGRGYGY